MREYFLRIRCVKSQQHGQQQHRQAWPGQLYPAYAVKRRLPAQFAKQRSQPGCLARQAQAVGAKQRTDDIAGGGQVGRAKIQASITAKKVNAGGHQRACEVPPRRCQSK